MAYSFPVYRRGMIIRTTQEVSVRRAHEIATLVRKHSLRFQETFMRAARESKQASRFKTDTKESLQPEISESYFLNFPSITFHLLEYTVKTRLSLNVCMHGHQHKLWLYLACLQVGGRPARGLSATQVRGYFSCAEKKGTRILRAEAGVYCELVRQSGVSVPASKPYIFQLRAFNSASRSSMKLFEDLRGGLALREAFESKAYRPQLLDYFRIVLQSDQVTPADVAKALANDESLEMFGYKSEKHDALFVAKTTDEETDLCGYGFDDARECNNKTLAQAVTRELLNIYAQEF